MKKIIYIIPILLLIIVLHNPTSTTIIESNKYKTPANPAFDDDNFYKCITNTLGVSQNTNVTDEQLARINNLDCENMGISSTKGIEKLTGATTIRLPSNKIKNINISQNLSLRYLYMQSNLLTTIDVSNNQSLYLINIYDNYIESIDVSNNTRLDNLIIDKGTNIIGSNDNIRITYLEIPYVFDNNQTRMKDGMYEYSIDVDNSIVKFSSCTNHYYDTMLCSSKIMDLFSQAKEVYYNNELFNIEEFMTLYQEKIMEHMEEYIDYLTKASNRENAYFKVEFGNNEVYMEYKDGEKISYTTLFDLLEGENTLKIIMNDNTEYTIHITRKTIGMDEEEASKEIDKIVEDITTNNNVDNNIKYPPDTGIFTAILLSLLSIGIVVELYFVYYRKKVKN